MSAVKINLVLFGIGNVGSALINQVVGKQQSLLEEKNIELVFSVITNSTLAFFEREDKKNRWDVDFTKSPAPFSVQNIVDYVKEEELENLIAIDATASTEILESYNLLLRNNFNILSINTNSSIQKSDFYAKINHDLEKFDKKFIYQNEQTEVTPINLLDHILEIGGNHTVQKLQIA